jgi:hypothetical protein
LARYIESKVHPIAEKNRVAKKESTGLNEKKNARQRRPKQRDRQSQKKGSQRQTEKELGRRPGKQSNQINKKTDRSKPPSPLPKRKRKENRDPQHRRQGDRAEEGDENRSDLPENHRCTLCIISIRSLDGLEQQ